MIRRLTAIICILACVGLYAKPSKKLEKRIEEFFDEYNTVSNTTSPELINSQLGVHYIGGTGEVRSGVYDVNPIHVSLPSFSAGCGGIDYNFGGINIASKDEMKRALKSIASNSVGYAFLLGLETVSPSVASTMKQVQTWANQLNSININSCEIASSLVQGAWPKTQRASSYICEHSGSSSPLFKDLIEAKHGCRDDSQKREEAYKNVAKNNKNILIENYNIAWKALEDSNLDKETKELFMNMSGTIVVQEGDTIKVYPPQFKKAMDILRTGGSIQNGYKIADDNIGIQLNSITISPQHAWKSKIHKILTSLQNKIVSEHRGEKVELSQDEINLVRTTRFPIGTLLSLMAQYNGQGGVLALDRYSEIIAFERVLSFSEEVLRDTLRRAEALRAAQVSGFELNEYVHQVNGVLRDLQQLNSENFQKIATEHQVLDYLMNVDHNMRAQEKGP